MVEGKRVEDRGRIYLLELGGDESARATPVCVKVDDEGGVACLQCTMREGV